MYPEIAEAAILRGDADDFLIWSLLRSHDEEGSGGLTRRCATEVLQYVMEYSRSTAYRRLQPTDYWTLSGEQVYLKSIHKVCQMLGIEKLHYNSYVFAESCLRIGQKFRRAALFAIAVQSSKPQSYQCMAKRCGISKRTAIAYMNMVSDVRKTRNYAFMESFDTLRDAKIRHQEVNPYKVGIFYQDGFYYLLDRLPNTYELELARGMNAQRKRINKKLGAKFATTPAYNHIYLKCEPKTNDEDEGNQRYVFQGYTSLDKTLGEPDIFNHQQEPFEAAMWKVMEG